MSNDKSQERSKLEVICENLLRNPPCPHGPTLLFKRTSGDDNVAEEYFACSAYRSLKGCKFYLTKSEWDANPCKIRSHYWLHFDDAESARSLRRKILAKVPEKRCYCHSCNVLFKLSRMERHKEHSVQEGISDELFKYPTRILRPLNDDKAEAQYFFDNRTLDFLGNCFSNLGIRKVACVGAPKLHEYLKSKQKELQIESFLLDLDHRFLCFLEDEEFAWYNMFNNHFFEGNPKIEIFENFLRVNSKEPLLIFTDPPFGCRTEPLINTIKEISATYRRVNTFHQILSIFWIYPYFMEFYIKKFMPEMEMVDYKINYTNHDLYNDGAKGRKQGSPVRLFTNIPNNLIKLPVSEGYKYCEKCDRYTGIENIHCDICKTCPSKNGETYRHCTLCASCVKPNYVHCDDCGRCTQKENHNCKEYQDNLYCWICKRQNHTEMKCKKWKVHCKRVRNLRKNFTLAHEAMKKGCKLCLLCTKIGHNERNCPKRQFILKEKCFMGSSRNIIDCIV